MVVEKSGYLSIDSLKKFYGGELSDAAALATIQCADWDADGLISEK
jgi:hypothetical protein